MNPMKVRLAAGGMTAAALATMLVAAAPAQNSPPIVRVTTSGKGKLTMTGAQNLQPGPVRFIYERTVKGAGAGPSLVQLRDGVSVEEFVNRVRGAKTAQPIKDIARLVGGADISVGLKRHAVTHTLAAATYVLLDGSENIGSGKILSFAVTGASNLAVPPRANASITMRDYSFKMPKTLPETGIIRIENKGQRFHFAEALRVADNASAAAAQRALRAGRQPTAFTDIQGIETLVSPGVVNRAEVTLEPGRWILVCQYADKESGNRSHARLGMTKIFTVK